MYVAPFDGSVSPNALSSPAANAEAEGGSFQGTASAAAGDNISRFFPPWMNQSNGDALPGYGEGFASPGSPQGLFGPLMSLLQQLMQMLQSLMGYGCNGGCSPNGNERYFQNATGSSDGDPHLSFNGAKWNNMASQPNLLDSNSFPGGFRLSTQVTPPSAKGVTWNQSATVSLNDGGTQISMNDNGEASITNYGQSVSIAPGQTLKLGDGESVTYEQNGSLRVTAQNSLGGRIESTLTPHGKGVNVDVTAHDVDLGGALVTGYEQQPGAPPLHGTVWGPGPSPAPISGPFPRPISPPSPVVPPLDGDIPPT